MIKLVCPCCGWSDFLKYDYDDVYHDTWYCLCCGLEFDDLRVLEKEVPDSEYDGYGLTIVNVDKEAYYDEFLAHYDEYYAKYAVAIMNYESKEISGDGAGWVEADETCPFWEGGKLNGSKNRIY